MRSDPVNNYCVPPDVYAVGVGWNPQPEVERLLFLAGEANLQPRSVLELGCATGRLLSPFAKICPVVHGLELHPPFLEYARSRVDAAFIEGDMTDFRLDRRFDLIFTSANTIRHALEEQAVSRMWRCIAEHLTPGGVFIADLELGREHAAAEVGRPISWEVAHERMHVRATWRVTADADPRTSCCPIEYTFESLEEHPGVWRSRFDLRTYDAGEFLRLARRSCDLIPIGLYENREPYLIETPAEKAQGRYLAVFERDKATRQPGNEATRELGNQATRELGKGEAPGEADRADTTIRHENYKMIKRAILH